MADPDVLEAQAQQDRGLYTGRSEDLLARHARPGCSINRDTTAPFVSLAVAQAARDEAAEAVLNRFRCGRCGGHGENINLASGGVSECGDCAGTGIDPDITLVDAPDPDDLTVAGETTTRAIEADRARIRRAVAHAYRHINPGTVTAETARGILGAILDIIDDDREADNWQALTAADLHELAEYPEEAAALMDAGDHRTDEDPNPWFEEEAARLRALANRARTYLGTPAVSPTAGDIPNPATNPRFSDRMEAHRMTTDTHPNAYEINEDGYWVAVPGHVDLADFKAAARPVLLNPSEGDDWTNEPTEDQEWFLAEEAKRIDRDGVQHAYRIDDPAGVDYEYQPHPTHPSKPVTIWGAGNLNGAGGPPAPDMVRS
jgi:hypothetical protein